MIVVVVVVVAVAVAVVVVVVVVMMVVLVLVVVVDNARLDLVVVLFEPRLVLLVEVDALGGRQRRRRAHAAHRSIALTETVLDRRSSTVSK